MSAQDSLNFKSELPTFSAKADGVSVSVDVLQWWKNHETELPSWSSVCKKALLIQPSSAAAERVFSILQNLFNEKQTLSLQDYIESSVMLQYNTRKE